MRGGASVVALRGSFKAPEPDLGERFRSPGRALPKLRTQLEEALVTIVVTVLPAQVDHSCAFGTGDR